MGIQRKLKECIQCKQLKIIWKTQGRDRYCQNCWNYKSTLSTGVAEYGSKKKQKPIAPRSPKRAKQERFYSKERRIFLLANPLCKAKLPGKCTISATDVHHTKGREGWLLLAIAFWIPLCRACHMWAEEHPNEAKELKLSLNRLSNN